MRRILLFTCFSLSVSLAFSQVEQLQFINTHDTLCVDGITPLVSYVNWEAYQTLDNTWDGPRDSSVCINIYPGHIVHFDEFDLDKPVYYRALFDSLPVLQEDKVNYVYYNTSGLYYEITDSTICEDGWCEGILVGIEIPADTVDSSSATQMRWYWENWNINWWCSAIDFCLPTEYFQGENKLKEFVVKIQYNNPWEGGYDQIGTLDLMSTGDCTKLLDTLSITNYQTDCCDIWLEDWSECYDQYCYFLTNFLVDWNGDGIPADTNRYYLDILPIPNSTEPQNLVVHVSEMNGLHFQPFTFLRGGLVEGSDSVRHSITIENNGMFCLGTAFIEFVFKPHDKYLHQGGMLSLQHGSCMRFEVDATLEVGNNATLHYGSFGNGMIALHSGSHVVLDEGASLVFDCPVSLWENAWETTDQFVEVVVGPGRSLVFAPFAEVWDKSNGRDMKLIIRMQGGYLDIRGLTEEDLSHVIIIYPHDDLAVQILQIGANPGNGPLRFSLHANQSGPITFQLTDMKGSIVWSTKEVATTGFNSFELTLDSQAPGSYLFTALSCWGKDSRMLVRTE